MTDTIALQEDYMRGKSISGKGLAIWSHFDHTILGDATRLAEVLKAYALSSDYWRHTRDCRPFRRPAGNSTILEAARRR